MEVFTNDPLADCKTPITRLVNFVIERNNKYYGDYYMGIDEDGDYYIKNKGKVDDLIYITKDPRKFLRKVEDLRFYS